MIQRKQSVYLLLTILLSLIFLNGEYLTFFDNSGSTIKLSLSEIVKYSSDFDASKIGEVWLIRILSALIPLLSLVIIFLFKKRELQIKLTGILLLLTVVFIASSLGYSYMIISKYEAAFAAWYKLIIPVLQMVLAVLAYRGIKKDDDLVKSYERLR